MKYWLVTMFDKHLRKEAFHVCGDTAADAMDWTAHTLVKNNKTGFKPIEVHVQLLEPSEADSLVRSKP